MNNLSASYADDLAEAVAMGMLEELVREAQAELEVGVASRSTPPPWGSNRFRPLICTYAPWGARVDELAKSRICVYPPEMVYRSVR